MTIASVKIDIAFFTGMRIAALRRAAASAVVAVSLLSTVNAAACVDPENIESQATSDQADPQADFLAKYIDWAKTIEAAGQIRGTPLSATQLELARHIGIEHPEKVRLVFVEAVPFPTHDKLMRKMGENLGFIGPGVINNAQAFGYTIWVRDGFALDRPSLAHELVHVAQIERSVNFGEYVERYMRELSEYGHGEMPLEVEAYKANTKYQ